MTRGVDGGYVGGKAQGMSEWTWHLGHHNDDLRLIDFGIVSSEDLKSSVVTTIGCP